MRVTMLVRCLAMMRGGGETRHLAWMRELTALGVEVDVITGQPLLLGGALFRRRRHAHDSSLAYLRDWVYTFQRKRGFGRLTMDALHLDEEWSAGRRGARLRAGARPPTSSTRTPCIRRRACAADHRRWS